MTRWTRAAPEYAIVWQDTSGSWLSVYYGPQTGMVKSFPFASSTDFGGPDLQPPLVGLARHSATISGSCSRRSHSVELWRIDRAGNRAVGLAASSVGRRATSATSSSASSPGLLTSTYADLTGASMGRRLIVDAVCY